MTLEGTVVRGAIVLDQPGKLPEGARVKVILEEAPKRRPRQPGNCKGMMTIVADDDEHLQDFAEYMR